MYPFGPVHAHVTPPANEVEANNSILLFKQVDVAGSTVGAPGRGYTVALKLADADGQLFLIIFNK